MAKAKKKQVKKVMTFEIKYFKDLEVGKTFVYNGDECLCEVQEEGITIFDNKVQNKRYKMNSDKVVK